MKKEEEEGTLDNESLNTCFIYCISFKMHHKNNYYVKIEILQVLNDDT